MAAPSRALHSRIIRVLQELEVRATFRMASKPETYLYETRRFRVSINGIIVTFLYGSELHAIEEETLDVIWDSADESVESVVYTHRDLFDNEAKDIAKDILCLVAG